MSEHGVITASTAAKRIAERSMPLVLRRGSLSHVALVEDDSGRFVLRADIQHHHADAEIHLHRDNGEPFENGHELTVDEAERAARKLLGIDRRSLPKHRRL